MKFILITREKIHSNSKRKDINKLFKYAVVQLSNLLCVVHSSQAVNKLTCNDKLVTFMSTTDVFISELKLMYVYVYKEDNTHS